MYGTFSDSIIRYHDETLKAMLNVTDHVESI